MSEYDNELRGALFKNERKEAGDTKADYTGSMTVEGTDYFMDAWLNKAKDGRTYMSVKLKRKDKQSGAAPPVQRPQARAGATGSTADAWEASRPSRGTGGARVRELDDDGDVPF